MNESKEWPDSPIQSGTGKEHGSTSQASTGRKKNDIFLIMEVPTKAKSSKHEKVITLAAAHRTAITLSVKQSFAALYISLCTLDIAVPIPQQT